MIAILGSGFGLYGYLPALVQGCGQTVILPDEYRSRLAGRPEIAHLANKVEWAPNKETTINQADGVILAMRPIDQGDWARRCLAAGNIKRILLEKPVAPSPDLARALLAELACAGKVIRVGYTFGHTSWAGQLRQALSSPSDSSELRIQWKFLAHHFSNDGRNWKRLTSSGGGALRYYGIQLIGLLAELGYDDIISSIASGDSPDEIGKWRASFAAPNLPHCEILVDSKAAEESFHVQLTSETHAAVIVSNQASPFESGDEYQERRFDRRVPVLSRLCSSLLEGTTDYTAQYAASIELWRRVERETKFSRYQRN
jgi:predicted dehydrogenase